MKLPSWTELSERDQRRLIDLATTFAVGPDVNMLLPTEIQARGIAMEMYYLSRWIIEELNQE
jgi:hypothetical protein